MDWPSLGAQAIVALTSVVTTLLVYLLRKVLPKIPKVALPWISIAIGWAATFVSTLAGGPEMPVIVVALIGAGGVWLYEAQKQIREYLGEQPK